MTVGHAHKLVVNRLLNIVPRLDSFGCHLSIQNPITLPPRHEPEPDGAIVRGVPEDYGDRHPGPADVLCVIEVAETSLLYDRTTKQRIYAGAEIPQYVLVNIPGRQIEIYGDPLTVEGRYSSQVVVQSPQSLRLALGLERHLEILVDDLLPRLG